MSPPKYAHLTNQDRDERELSYLDMRQLVHLSHQVPLVRFILYNEDKYTSTLGAMNMNSETIEPEDHKYVAELAEMDDEQLESLSDGF